MNRTEIENKVRDFLIEDLEVDEEKIYPDARLKEDVGIDSLDFVDIVVIVEKNFGFKIKPEEMAGVATLNDFYSYIESKVGWTETWQMGRDYLRQRVDAPLAYQIPESYKYASAISVCLRVYSSSYDDCQQQGEKSDLPFLPKAIRLWTV